MTSRLRGLRVLVVEDVSVIAESLGGLLRDYGCKVVGPAPDLERGVELALGEPLDGAILDVDLHGNLCFPIAATLSRRGIPYFFVTGYGDEVFPAEYRGMPRLGKPFEEVELAGMLLHEVLHVA